MILNVEIKALCTDHNPIRDFLHSKSAIFKGKDHQIDTYFAVKNGRLKLREGNIESNLIFYERNDIKGPKTSKVSLYKPSDSKMLKELLLQSMGQLIKVDKQREIYFIENVKFHLDEVENLGKFVEIEAIDADGNIGLQKLNDQCAHYLSKFNIKEEHLISQSYSDLLAANE